VILLWGIAEDGPLANVRDALARRGADTLFVDQRLISDTTVELRVDGCVGGIVRIGGFDLELEAVTAAYVRPYDSRRLPGVEVAGERSPDWFHAIGVEDCLLSWADITQALIVNRPEAMASNSSKPYQAALLRKLGFAVPETLITTDSAAASEFWERHGDAIYKSISGVRSVVSRLSPAHRERMADLQWCPTQFQQYITGRDYRVHVVGDEVFAAEIISAADDYRYASRQSQTVEINAVDLPVDCVDRCRTAAAALGLVVAGIDLRRAGDEWYCFEVNPSPGFTYYEDATEQPIGDAIASLLVRAPHL